MSQSSDAIPDSKKPDVNVGFIFMLTKAGTISSAYALIFKRPDNSTRAEEEGGEEARGHAGHAHTQGKDHYHKQKQADQTSSSI